MRFLAALEPLLAGVAGTLGAMSSVRIKSVLQWLPTVTIAVVASYFVLGVAAWCWEGAYNVLQGDSPAYGFSAVLIVAGSVPVVAAVLYCVRARRNDQSRRSSLALASLVALVTSVFVGIFRAGASGGF